nr:unnamed protein product [Callosobruchus analis]
MSQRNAAITFNVPRATIQFRMSEKFKDKITSGPSPVVVQGILEKAAEVTAASSTVAEADIRKWFSGIEEYLEEKNLKDILQDPNSFKTDKTCFYLCPQNKSLSSERIKLQIVLVALYPNSTHILQPADVAVFKPFKNGWKAEVLAFKRDIRENNLKPSTIKNGFKVCGIYKWCPSAVGYSNCLGKSHEKATVNDSVLHIEPTSAVTYTEFENIAGAEKFNQYTEADIKEAFEAIKNGMSQRKAARQFNVPGPTLQFRGVKIFAIRLLVVKIPNPILSLEEELALQIGFMHVRTKAFPPRIDVQKSIKGYLDANPRENPFTDNMPGRGWYRCFLKTNLEIQLGLQKRLQRQFLMFLITIFGNGLVPGSNNT